VPPGIIANAFMLELLNAFLVLRQFDGAWSAIVYFSIELTSLVGALKLADGMEGALTAFALEKALSGEAMTEGVETG